MENLHGFSALSFLTQFQSIHLLRIYHIEVILSNVRYENLLPSSTLRGGPAQYFNDCSSILQATSRDFKASSKVTSGDVFTPSTASIRSSIALITHAL